MRWFEWLEGEPTPGPIERGACNALFTATRASALPTLSRIVDCAQNIRTRLSPVIG